MLTTWSKMWSVFLVYPSESLKIFSSTAVEVLVPMVVEEPSIIAGASFMAKLARPAGGFFAHLSASEMIAQIQVIHVPEINTARLKLLEAKSKLLELCRSS